MGLLSYITGKDTTPHVNYGEGLDALARRANQAHASGRAAQKRAVECYHMAGLALVAAKGQLKHGEWGTWLATCCPEISARHVRRYMTFAEGACTEERWQEACGRGEDAKTDTVSLLPEVLPVDETPTPPPQDSVQLPAGFRLDPPAPEPLPAPRAVQGQTWEPVMDAEERGGPECFTFTVLDAEVTVSFPRPAHISECLPVAERFVEQVRASLPVRQAA